jgi:enterochelin esterase-like enzyme
MQFAKSMIKTRVNLLSTYRIGLDMIKELGTFSLNVNHYVTINVVKCMDRRLIVNLLFILIATGLSFSQGIDVMSISGGIDGSNFQQFVNRVNSAPAPDRTAIVDSFMAVAPSFPYIEDPIAYFIYRGSVTSVYVPGDANGWNPTGSPMTKLSTTDLWYSSQFFESDARLDYKFVLNGSSWILDPRNSHTVSGGYGPNSELAMPQYVQPWEIVYRPSILHGRTESKTIYSTFRSVNYSVRIYLPPGYDASMETYPTVYFQDGSEYVSLGSTVNVLDNLIDSIKIRPVIGIFVTPINRNEEYAGSVRTQYQQFFAYELVPFIDSVYRTIASPQYRAVIGDSYGGNISALISYNHPDLFGNCGLHSGAFQPYSYEAFNLIVNGAVKKDSIKYCSIWGTYESSLTQNMRAFRDSLIFKGYDFIWQERHEGHSWGLWRATTDIILQDFFPVVTGVNEFGTTPVAAHLDQNYPNPFNPRTNITFSIPAESYITLKIYDLLGREVGELAQGKKAPGHYSVPWNADGMPDGIYFCRIKVSNLSSPGQSVTEVRKMLLLK